VVFEWDEKKNTLNQLKHSISFEDALYVFADPFAVTRPDICEREERHQILGTINGVLMALVVYTFRKEDGETIIRIISARKATLAERSCKKKDYRYCEYLRFHDRYN